MQTKRGSMFEISCSIGSGFIISMLMWHFVAAPFVTHTMNGDFSSAKANFYMTCLFTITSLIRSYFWRRLFNWLEYKQVVR